MKAVYFVALVVFLSTILLVAAQSPKPTPSGGPTKPPQRPDAPNKPIIAPNPASCPWTYSGNTGPYFWNSLCTKDCAGTAQSPIDILPHFTTPKQDLGQIYTNYSDAVSTIQYDGKNLWLTPVLAGFGFLKQLPNLPYLQSATKYSFKSAKIHVSSEHTVYGMPFNAEIHMVHSATVNGTATSNVVICVFLRIGRNSSKLLAPILKAMDRFTNASASTGSTGSFTVVTPVPWNTSFSLLKENDPLARNASYYHYIGSLSTPPCTKEVSHFIFKEPLSMSQNQYDVLYRLLSDKNRPLQRQNQRPVYFYNARASSASSLSVPFWAQLVQWLF